MDEHEDFNTGRMEQQHTRSLKETFRTGSPDDVREMVKQAVEKGIAAVSGALRGFADSAERDKFAETTKSAIHQAGETARTAVSSFTEEAKHLRAPLKDATQKLAKTGRELGSDLRQQWTETKDAAKRSEDRSESGMGMGMGGSSLGTSWETGLGREFPDISQTPLGKSDEELQDMDAEPKE